MSQNLDNKDLQKNLDKNFKLMAISAVVLLVLFVYTIYKSNAHIQGSSYYIGIIFLFVLLFIAMFLRMKQEKVKPFLIEIKTKVKNKDLLLIVNL